MKLNVCFSHLSVTGFCSLKEPGSNKRIISYLALEICTLKNISYTLLVYAARYRMGYKELSNPTLPECVHMYEHKCILGVEINPISY